MTAAAVAEEALELFTAVLKKTNDVAQSFITSSIGMTKSAASGAAGLEVMGASVSGVTSQFGVLGKAFGETMMAAIAVLEKNITTQQTLSNVGATFGGDLDRLRSISNKTYLSMDDFAKVVGSNSSILATFRGGVQQGTEFFSNSMESLMQRGSRTGIMMANLGVSASEAAEMTMQLMRGQGSMNKNGQMSAEELAAATANYAAELTALSDLTGQSRKALQEQAAAEMAEAQWQSFLSGLSDEEAGKLKAGLEKELAAGGKAAGDSFKAMAAGFPPLTKASQLFAATQGASIERQQEYIRIAKDANIKTDEALKLFSTTLIQSLPGVKEDIKRLGSVPMAMAISGGTDLSKALERLTLTLNAVTGKTLEEMDANYRKFVDGSKKGSQASENVDLQKGAIDSANSVLKAASSALAAALSKGITFGNFLNEKVAAPIMGAVGGALNSAAFAKMQAAISGMVAEIIKSIEGIDTAGVGKALETAGKTAANPKETGGPKIPAVAGALTGAMLDSITELFKQIVNFGNMAISLVNGDLKSVKTIWEKSVIPDFFKMLKGWSERIEQLGTIIKRPGASPGILNTPVPAEEQQQMSFTPPNRNNTGFLNTNFVQPDETEVPEPRQQVAYNEENTGEGAVDVNKLVDEKIVPLLAALVYNTGATERAIKNAPARFSNASYT
jgi:hypothetical protein